MLPKDPTKINEYILGIKIYNLLLKALGQTYKGGRPKGIIAWNKGKTNIELFGEEKAAELSLIQADNARRTRNHFGHTHSEESKELMRIASTGKPSGNRGNPSNYRHTQERKDKIKAANTAYWEEFWKLHPAEGRYRKKYQVWQLAVRQRDNDTCQYCGITQDELPTESSTTANCFLHCHHIKPWREFPKLRYEVSNGITLCPSCHRAEETRLALERKGIYTGIPFEDTPVFV
jgi:hypothetical protein